MKKWINKYLSENEIKEVSNQVEFAEKNTSGEIVPVIVKRSSSTSHVWLMVTIVLLFFAAMSDITLHFYFIQPLLLWTGIFLVAIIIGFGFSKIFIIQRMFVSEIDQRIQVHHRAELEFYRNQIQSTQGSTGVLIFISIMERKAVILADKGIADKMKPDIWNEILNKLIINLKKNQWSQGLKNTISEVGELLSQHFPVQENDQNELANQLIIKE